MLCKRIIPCLDVKAGRAVKGTNFVSLVDAGDPVALAQSYYNNGADELVLLDISATAEGRSTMIEVVKEVAREIFIPFTVGGGIKTISGIEALLKAGADKVSLNSSAIKNPGLIEKAAEEFGSQAIVVSIDAMFNPPSNNWQAYSKGGSVDSGLEACSWAKKAVSLGAGEILITSIDRDGTKDGFDISLTRQISRAVSVPVIASGGAGRMQDFFDVFSATKASAALAASLFHYGEVSIPKLKKYLKTKGVGMREN